MKSAFLIIVFLVGCATTQRPVPEQSGPVDYGPPPSNAAAIIHAVIGPKLIDPDSARYILSEPKRGINTTSGKRMYGWRVCGTINSRNRFGGYSGPKPIFALIYNDKVSVLLHAGFVIPDSFSMGIASSASSFDSYCSD